MTEVTVLFLDGTFSSTVVVDQSARGPLRERGDGAAPARRSLRKAGSE
jgi:hypothetical protein